MGGAASIVGIHNRLSQHLVSGKYELRFSTVGEVCSFVVPVEARVLHEESTQEHWHHFHLKGVPHPPLPTPQKFRSSSSGSPLA
jgi:hypothetical protein